jgi:hypothetical protein
MNPHLAWCCLPVGACEDDAVDRAIVFGEVVDEVWQFEVEVARLRPPDPSRVPSPMVSLGWRRSGRRSLLEVSGTGSRLVDALTASAFRPLRRMSEMETSMSGHLTKHRISLPAGVRPSRWTGEEPQTTPAAARRQPTEV